MYGDDINLRDIGAYDDFIPDCEEVNEGEGVFSPFTFLCFAIILTLLGLLTLFSASYDTALRNGEAFYSIFLRQVLSIPGAFLVGIPLCLLPLKYSKKSYFLLVPVHVVLFIFYTAGFEFTSDPVFLSSFGYLGTINILLLLSDTVPSIKEREKGGVILILTVILSLLLLLSVTVVAGAGWYSVSAVVIISILISQREKRSTVIYFVLCLFLLFALVSLIFPSVLDSISYNSMPVDDESLYSPVLASSVSAIKEGGINGTGIGNGLYKLGLLNGVEGEFIFASLSEETGIFGAVIIIFSSLMLLIIGVRSSRRAYRKDERYISAFILGSLSLLVFSFLTNMLYVSGLLPMEGVPLLLFSYNPYIEAVTIILLMFLYKFIYRVGREKAQ